MLKYEYFILIYIFMQTLSIPSLAGSSPPVLPAVQPYTMVSMFHRTTLRFALVFAVTAFTFSVSHAGAQDKNPPRVRKMTVPPAASRIDVSVIRDSNGKPVEHAAVIFHPLQGERDHGVLEVKTNEDGKAMVDVIPIGDTVRLQIIAKGFQTYGDDFKVDRPEISMEIRMKRPGEQYSIYKNHGDAANNGPNDNSQKPSEGDKPKQQAPPK